MRSLKYIRHKDKHVLDPELSQTQASLEIFWHRISSYLFSC